MVMLDPTHKNPWAPFAEMVKQVRSSSALSLFPCLAPVLTPSTFQDPTLLD